MKESENDKNAADGSVESSVLFCLQASDVFNDWETVYEFPTREQAEKMKEVREAEPVIYCPVHWRIVEQNVELTRGADQTQSKGNQP